MNQWLNEWMNDDDGNDEEDDDNNDDNDDDDMKSSVDWRHQCQHCSATQRLTLTFNIYKAT